ncbi:MAG: hypothetical protein HY377_01215 [Candidatus Blackburnbacteria bacterium]|nr:hypothetical protein [Candidatus Blackburnbacteria bacterium]
MKESLGEKPHFVYEAPLRYGPEIIDVISGRVEIGESTPKATYQVAGALLNRQKDGEEGVKVEVNGVRFQNGKPLVSGDPAVQAFLREVRRVNGRGHKSKAPK